ncbi:MAG TPA: cytochrome c peroxidase [Bacteroidia bacterium]|nr:cytochrome c peroxidase [Bacteroidia bacterium]
MKLNNGWIVPLVLGSSIFISCTEEVIYNPQPPDKIEFVVPQGFPQPVYQFTNNEVTNERFELGRKLFYDNILSRNNTISCGSCHQQAGAFAHIDHKMSHGIDDLEGTRNAPPIFNLAWHSNFMWDGGINHIEVQPIGPIQNPVEMDETLSNVITKLQANTEYKSLFKVAYGSDSITSQMMLRAMAQFMAVMVSADSKYDKYMRGEADGQMSVQELNGLNLFRQKCESCHSEPLFTDLTYRNNGLDLVFSDLGRALITLDPADEGKFKVPSLRNIELSYPYMHNGKIKTLEKVLDHYMTGIKPSPTLDPLLSQGIALTAQEKSDIISFLRTLTDNTFITNPHYADPN